MNNELYGHVHSVRQLKCSSVMIIKWACSLLILIIIIMIIINDKTRVMNIKKCQKWCTIAKAQGLAVCSSCAMFQSNVIWFYYSKPDFSVEANMKSLHFC